MKYFHYLCCREKRKLDYEQFRSALKLLAKKIYPEKIEPEEKFKKLEERILLEGRGPSLSDTTVSFGIN